VLLSRRVELGEGRKPLDGESAKHRLDTFPSRLSHPSRLLLLESFYTGLVIPDGGDLSAEHN